MTQTAGGSPAAGPREELVTDPQGVAVHVYVWDHPEPRAVVHVSHGVGEHAGRYAHVAQVLHDAGYAVVADDHRGHGATGVDHLGLGVLGKGAHHAVFDAVEAVARQARSWFAPAPFVMLGHSWGSLVAQKLLARSPQLFDGLVLSGTSYAVPGVINGGDLGKRFRLEGGSGFEWLSRDAAVGAAFAADPLTFDVNVRSPYTWRQALQLLGRPPRHLPRDVPVLIQGGAEDTLGGVRGMTMLAEAYRHRSGLTDVSLMIYPGARHEIYNETNRDEVLADLVAWLDARFGPRP